jgi:hypothetical protein
MAIMVNDTGGNFEQVPPGTHLAVCKGVYDIGQQKREWKGTIKYTRQVIIVFEVNERMTIEEHAGERFNISSWYTASLADKSNLRKDLESWRGRAFTSEELAGFDIEVLVGKTCLLSIVENDKGKSIISSISKPMKGAEAIKIEKPFDGIPEWIQKVAAEAYVEPENPPADPYKNSNNTKDDDIPF